jgi:hypothetical protein
METYKKLQAQKRRNGRKPEIIIDENPNVYEGHPISGYSPYQNGGGINQNNDDSPGPGVTFRNNAHRPNNANDPNAYYEPDDHGQLVQDYRKQQKTKRGGKDDGDNYEPQEMTGRSKNRGRRHSDGAGTDMGAPPDSYIMDKYLNTYTNK